MFTSNILKSIIVIVFMVMPVFSHASDKREDVIPYGQNTAVGKYADINGIKLYYEIYGSGKPLVLIHGNGDSIAGLTAQIKYFSSKYKVIVMDSRGHGKSGLGTERLNYIQMTNDLNALLNHLDIRNADIFGWSDGGILGLMLAIKHPEKINKLALMGAYLRPDQTAIHAWVKPLLDGAAKHVEAMRVKKDTSDNWGLQKQRLDLLMTQPNIDVQSLHQIKAPILVIAGDRDVIRLEHTIEIFQNLNNSHLAILPGQTHFAPMTSPAMFNELLNGFFERPFTKPTTKEIMEQH